jgi:hypothetical protein
LNVAVTLEELQIKFKSEIAAATSKDEAALARVDAAVRSSALGLDKLRAAHAKSAEAARAAEGTKGAAAAVARREASAAALASAQKQHSALAAGKPELLALAKQKQAVIEQSAAAKRASAEQAAAAKALAKAREDASDKAAEGRVAAQHAAMLGAAGVAVTLAAAIGAATVATVAFGLSAAGAARDARILADALTGSASLGKEFDTVVTQLASKVPMARGQIADLARELNLMKLGRRDMQAGLTAIAITTSAIGDAAGGVIKGVVQSSAAMKRFTLGARNMWGEYQGLAGSGLSSMDVLSALAKQLGVGVGEVEKRLRLGQVKLKDGLRALEAASQARFGKTIAAQMLSVNTQFTKARENLANMVSGVDLEPALKGLESLLSIFDESTVAGSVLKTLLNEGLNGISKAFGVILPLGKDFFLELAIGAMEMYLALRPIARQIRDWIEPYLTAENAAMAGKVAVYALAATFGVLAVAAGAAAAAIFLPFVLAGLAIWGLVKGAQAAWRALGDSGQEAAKWVIEGLVNGILGGVPWALEAIGGLGKSMAKKFREVLQIGSPSKLFFRYGYNVPEGAAGGVEAGAPMVQSAVDDMAPVPPGGVGGGARGLLGAGTVINVNVGDVYFAGQQASEQEKGGLVEFLKQQLQAGFNAAGAGEPIGVPA